MKNIDLIKTFDETDLAFMLCIDNEGEQRTCCSICQRNFENNCDDKCIVGVREWLAKEVSNGDKEN